MVFYNLFEYKKLQSYTNVEIAQDQVTFCCLNISFRQYLTRIVKERIFKDQLTDEHRCNNSFK